MQMDKTINFAPNSINNNSVITKTTWHEKTILILSDAVNGYDGDPIG